MTIAEQMTGILASLETWTESNKGSIHIAGDGVELIEMLAMKPGAFRVVLFFRDELPRGTFDECGKVDRTFLVVISRGRGLTIARDQNLVGQSSGGRPLFELAEECREVCRGYVTEPETEERPVTYKGLRPFAQSGELIMDALQIEFSIGTLIPNTNEQSTDNTFPDPSE